MAFDKIFKKIDEVSLVKGGKRLPKDKNLIQIPTEHPYIRLVDIKNNEVDKSNLMYIDNETFSGISNYVVEENDVCLAIVGNTIGLVFYIEKIMEGANLTENAVRIKFNEEINPRYAYYYLLSDKGQGQIKSRIVGSAQGKLPIYNVKNLELPIPKKEVQNYIANFLWNIDRKISLNYQMIFNLEQLAQTIFNRWFVDFEFPNENGEPYKSSGGEMVESELGLIPKVWSVGTFGEIASIASGKRPKIRNDVASDQTNIPLIGASKIIGYTNEILYNEAMVVIGRVGTHGVIQRFNQPCWPSDNTLVIISDYLEYVFQFLSTVDYKSLNRGSTQPLITQTDIKGLKLTLATKELFVLFDKEQSIYSNIISSKIIENEKLIELRDTLLPKLLSGEIEIPSEIEVIERVSIP